MVTLLGAAGGVIGAFVTSQLRLRTIDIGMIGNGMIAGLVAITAPSGYVEAWAGPIIGFVAGCIVVLGVIAIDKRIDDPIGATVGARPGRYLGHARVRPVHRAAAGRSTTPSAIPRRPVLLGQLHAADRSGGRRG